MREAPSYPRRARAWGSFRRLLPLLLSMAGACDVAYAPGISSMEVECGRPSSEADDRWRFSCYVSDQDGEGDVAGVRVELVDFDGAVAHQVTLEHEPGGRWRGDFAAASLSISCAEKPLYLFRFRATDLSGLQATAEFYP